jgi:pimeloyl-ACP methyl ester carboxylesterase
LILGGSVPGTWHPRIPGPVDEGAWTWVLADALTREGIVTLSLDSRGYGGSSGSYSSATRDDLAADAAAALKYLRSCEEVAPGRVGLLGCSQGGLVATRCAVGTDKPDFVVLMNTPCLPVDEVFMESARKIHEATGADPKQTARYLALRSEVLALVKTDRPEAEVRQYITGKYPAAVLRKLRMDGPMLTSLLDWSLTPITRSFIKYDPRPDLIRLQTPVFLLQGECDLHVPARQNVDAVNRLRGENQLTTFTVSVIPDMNHSFQRTKGLEVIGDDTIDPQVPSLIAAWINRTIVK